MIASWPSMTASGLVPSFVPRTAQHRFDPRAIKALTADAIDFYNLYDDLVRNGKTEYESAQSILSILEEEAASGDMHSRHAHKASKVLTKAMSSCGRQRQWREALDILNQMNTQNLKPDTRAYNAALSACARANQAEALLSTLRAMSTASVKSDVHTFTVAIDGMARAGMTGEALRLFERMGTNGMPPPDAVSYNAAIAAAARSGAWEQALALLKRMSAKGSVGVTLEAMSGAMTACTNGDQPDLALRLFSRIEQADLRADSIAYSAALTAHSKGGSYGDALSLFRRMRRDGVARDVVCYNSMLHAAAVMAPRHDRNGHALDLPQRHAQRLHSLLKREGVRADDVTYSVLLQSLWHRPAATALLDEAMARPTGVFPRCLTIKRPPEGGVAAGTLDATLFKGGEHWSLDLHHLSPGAAVAMALWLLSQLAKRAVSPRVELPTRVRIITGWGRSSGGGRGAQGRVIDEWANGRLSSTVRFSVLEALRACHVPLEDADVDAGGTVKTNPGLVEVDTGRLRQWANVAISSGLIRGYFGVEDRLIIQLSETQARAIEMASSASATPAKG